MTTAKGLNGVFGSPRERSALASLKPSSALCQDEFAELIMNQLAVIRDPNAFYERDLRPTRSGTVHQLRKWARMAEQMASNLEKQTWLANLSRYIVWADPPTKELREYASHLNERADYLAQEIIATHSRHRVHQLTREIVSLVILVKECTGKPYWKELTILIAGATNDLGWTEDRLRKLFKYSEQKASRPKAI